MAPTPITGAPPTMAAWAIPFCTDTSSGARIARTYDAHGNVLTDRTEYTGETFDWSFTYDARGRVVTRQSSIQGPQPLQETIEYDYENNKLVRRRTHDRRGPDEWSSTSDYVYAGDGRLSRISTGNPRDPSYRSDTYFSYDNDGNLIGDVTADKTMTLWTWSRYDHDGRMTDEVSGPRANGAGARSECHGTFESKRSTWCCTTEDRSTCNVTEALPSARADQRLERRTSYTSDTAAIIDTVTTTVDVRGLAIEETSVARLETERVADRPQTTRSRYDARGNLVETMTDPDGDGVFEPPSLTRTFDCLEAVFSAMPRRAYVERKPRWSPTRE